MEKIELFKIFLIKNDQDWENISKLSPNKSSGLELKIKWFSMQKSKKQNHFWLYEEDQLLINLTKFNFLQKK